jgi:hypothetical protein
MADRTLVAGPTGLCVAGYREVCCLDDDGHPFLTWERIVPRIDDDVLDCTVYLYKSKNEARKGVAYGGSGFLVGVPFGYDHPDFTSADIGAAHHLYAVTNEHVARSHQVVRLSAKNGGLKPIDLAERWINHKDGDDLSIAPVGLNRDFYKFKFVSNLGSPFITEKLFNRLELGPGDETFMVGRFVARDETQSNVPIVRFGHISSSRSELIDQGEDRGHFKQESYLVECHSVSGSSGSPVFVWLPEERAFKSSFHSNDKFEQQQTSRLRREHLVPREFLLGIDWGHLDEKNPAGMAGVVPAWKLLDLLKDERIIDMRRAKEDEIASTPHGKLDVSHPGSQKTHPQKGQPVDIPIPTKSEVMDLFKKATRKRKS